MAGGISTTSWRPPDLSLPSRLSNKVFEEDAVAVWVEFVAVEYYDRSDVFWEGGGEVLCCVLVAMIVVVFVMISLTEPLSPVVLRAG